MTSQRAKRIDQKQRLSVLIDTLYSTSDRAERLYAKGTIGMTNAESEEWVDDLDFLNKNFDVAMHEIHAKLEEIKRPPPVPEDVKTKKPAETPTRPSNPVVSEPEADVTPERPKKRRGPPPPPKKDSRYDRDEDGLEEHRRQSREERRGDWRLNPPDFHRSCCHPYPDGDDASFGKLM